MNNLMENLMGV